jgi:hypothetical protein
MQDDPTNDDLALEAVRRIDAIEDAEYEEPLTDADGTVLDPNALAVDSLPGPGDDTGEVELTLGQTDDVLPDGGVDPR